MAIFFVSKLHFLHSRPLPENVNMPCAKIFAVCFFSDTPQRDYLPCASKKTHGKEKTNGKPLSSPCANPRHTANTKLCRVPPMRHTAKAQHVPVTCSCRPVPSRCVMEILLHRVPQAGHTAKPLRRLAAVTAVSVHRVPREAHGEELPLPCA